MTPPHAAFSVEESSTLQETHRTHGCTPRRSRSKTRREYTPRTSRVLKRLRTSNSWLRSCLSRARKQQDRVRQISKAELVARASHFLSKHALEIFRVQLYLQPLSKYGRRWSDSFKPFALNLYFHSPKTYIYLGKQVVLPSVISLRNSLADIGVEPGIMTTVVQTLKKKVAGWSLKDRMCILLFDES